MNIDILISVISPAIGVIISLFVLYSWINKPHEKEHNSIFESLKSLQKELQELNTKITELQIEITKTYVTKDAHNEINKKIDNIFLRQ